MGQANEQLEVAVKHLGSCMLKEHLEPWKRASKPSKYVRKGLLKQRDNQLFSLLPNFHSSLWILCQLPFFSRRLSFSLWNNFKQELCSIFTLVHFPYLFSSTMLGIVPRKSCPFCPEQVMLPRLASTLWSNTVLLPPGILFTFSNISPPPPIPCTHVTHSLHPVPSSHTTGSQSTRPPHHP